MPTSEAPTEVNEPKGPAQTSPDTSPDTSPEPESPAGGGVSSPVVRGSRWIDYDTHELLEMIGELEDERRWARLREGVLWAILFHLALLLALFLLPRYIKAPAVIEANNNIKNHKDFTYLDSPYQAPPRPVRPLIKPPVIDRKTLEEMNKPTPPAPAPVPAPQPAQTAPQAPVQPKPQPTQPIPPTTQSQIEAPRPAAVPARPNFAMNSQNPADQLSEAMRNAMRNRGGGSYGAPEPSGGLARHPGAGSGGVQVLSDTQGVDFSSWLARWHYVTEQTWDPLIPDEVNPPISKSGMVAIRFKVLPNGQVTDMQLEGRSGDSALDRAAWGAISGSSYQALPRDFHGPYLELRAFFLYNMQPPR